MRAMTKLEVILASLVFLSGVALEIQDHRIGGLRQALKEAVAGDLKLAEMRAEAVRLGHGSWGESVTGELEFEWAAPHRTGSYQYMGGGRLYRLWGDGLPDIIVVSSGAARIWMNGDRVQVENTYVGDVCRSRNVSNDVAPYERPGQQSERAEPTSWFQ